MSYHSAASMKLPNATHAVVDVAKLRDYCLNPGHARGRHKARVFASVLGIRRARHDSKHLDCPVE
jgi:hypothetical protein